MKRYVIKPTDGPEIRFAGRVVAEYDCCDEPIAASGRWLVLRLYRTSSGKFVCEKIEHTTLEGERDFVHTEVTDTLAGVFGFFGGGWASMKLYRLAGLSYRLEV